MLHNYQILEKGNPLKEANKAIILLHGRGGSAQDIITLANEFCDNTFYIAAPQATHNTWYPYSFMAAEKSNEPWLTSAIDTVKKLIDETAEHIPLAHIYLMGFSQGACLTLEVATQFAMQYAGVAAFTGGLIGRELDPDKYHGNFNGTKVFIGNSDNDPHVPLHRSQETKNVMERLGADVTLKVYPKMPHTINQDEIEQVKRLMFVSGGIWN